MKKVFIVALIVVSVFAQAQNPSAAQLKVQTAYGTKGA